MKKYAVLLLMFLMVLGSTNGRVNAVVSEHRTPSFVLSEVQMPVYKLITPEVNASYAASLADSLFLIRAPGVEEVEGRYLVNSGNKCFEIDSRDGSIWYADYSLLWNLSLGIEVPDPSASRLIAETFLNEKGLLPGSAVFANIGSANATAYNPDSGQSRSKVLQYHVNYEFVQGDIPVTGEAAQISVMIGEGGTIVAVDWKWREVESAAYAEANLIEFDSILDVYGIPLSEVVEHRLVYDVDDEEENNNLLFPVYEITLLETDDDGFDTEILLKFDATEFDPQVEIVDPSSSITVRPGHTLTFDCNVIYGSPPYTYEWKSDFDGVLSTAKTFTTSTLSAVLKKDVPVPHAISISVWDSEGRWTRDVVAVTIDENAPISLDVTVVLVAGGAVVVLLSSFYILRRRRAGFVLILLLMFLTAFMFLPATSASGELSTFHEFTPSAPTGAYDDGVKEVGIEWVGLTHGKPLPNTETNIEGFYNWMGIWGGYNREFNWGEYSAWEEDFKDAAFSGTDTEWIDAVDFVYYQDHGGPDGVSFTSNHDDTVLHYAQMKLGDGDLDTIVFDACSPLRWENSNGDDVFERWAPTMQGVHMVLSFATTSNNARTRGSRFGLYMTGILSFPGTTIINAWFRACAETEGSDRLAAVFYASKSPDPFNPQLDDPINDHAYGFGYVCSDPTLGTFSWYVYITASC